MYYGKPLQTWPEQGVKDVPLRTLLLYQREKNLVHNFLDDGPRRGLPRHDRLMTPRSLPLRPVLPLGLPMLLLLMRILLPLPVLLPMPLQLRLPTMSLLAILQRMPIFLLTPPIPLTLSTPIIWLKIRSCWK